MATIPATAQTGGLGRAWRLLTTPRAEWTRIAAEPLSASRVFANWVVPFAAIGPLAGLIAGAAYGYKRQGFAYYPSLEHGLAGALATYLFTLAAVWGLALVIEALAPNFRAAPDRAGAMKLIGYSGTAAWLAGLVGLIPGAGWLGLIGLYSAYLLWAGLPIVARPGEKRAIPYFAVGLIAAVFAFLVVALASSSIAALVAPPMLADAGTAVAPVPLSAPTPAAGADVAGAASARAQARAMAAVRQEQSGVPVPALQALLPATVDAFTRRDLGGSSGVTGGTRADASYIQDRDSFTLTISDDGPPDTSAAMPAPRLQQTRQSATGFERTISVNGMLVHERWDGATRAGAFETRVANRFTISAQGTVPHLDVLKRAVASVDRTRLAALGRK